MHSEGSPTGWREDRLQEEKALIARLLDPDCVETQQEIFNSASHIFGWYPPSGWPWEARPIGSDGAVTDIFGRNGPLCHFSEANRLEIKDLIRRADLEVARRSVAILSSKFNRGFYDAYFSENENSAHSEPPPGSASLSLLSEISRDYLTEYKKTHVGVRPDRVSKIEANIVLITEFLGMDSPVSSLDRKRCREFRDLLANLPSNMSKRFPQRSVSLDEVVRLTRLNEYPVLNVATQSGYLATLKDLAKWSATEGNPWPVDISNLKPLGERQHKADAKLPFSLPELKALFGSNLYRTKSTPKKGGHIADHSKYWIPLLALFTGMRLNEICQLETADIKLSSDSIWYISVNSNSEGKKLKTRNAERRIPIHSELLKLGFIKFVENQKASLNSRIFSELRKTGKDLYSTEFSKWFGRTYLKYVGIHSPKVSFHSFRHNFRDGLRNAGVNVDFVYALGGWASNEGVSENYGLGNKAIAIKNLKAAIDAINYDIDLSDLFKMS